MKKYFVNICAVTLGIACSSFNLLLDRNATVIFRYIGPTFTMGDTSPNLSNAANWEQGDQSCSSIGTQNKMCKAIVNYNILQPSETQIIEKIVLKYVANNYSFSDQESFSTTLNFENVTITIDLKAGA